ncbi:HNH endonuclease [Candidatus Dojkabacteria bacterium]|jgi:hypothetical protein|nr:HNH endonuclease [Candidatus Dojkabacteria bacterium]
MKQISLGQLSGKGKFVIVDNEDFEYLNQFKWYIKFSGQNEYAIRHKRYDETLMHRLIINTPKGMETDHINHNGLDNRRVNLRIVTTSQNQRNLRKKDSGIIASS